MTSRFSSNNKVKKKGQKENSVKEGTKKQKTALPGVELGLPHEGTQIA